MTKHRENSSSQAETPTVISDLDAYLRIVRFSCPGHNEFATRTGPIEMSGVPAARSCRLMIPRLLPRNRFLRTLHRPSFFGSDFATAIGVLLVRHRFSWEAPASARGCPGYRWRGLTQNAERLIAKGYRKPNDNKSVTFACQRDFSDGNTRGIILIHIT